MTQSNIVNREQYKAELETALKLVNESIDHLKVFDKNSRDVECYPAVVRTLRDEFASIYLTMPNFQIISNMKILYAHFSSLDRLDYDLRNEGLPTIERFFQVLQNHIYDEIRRITGEIAMEPRCKK